MGILGYLWSKSAKAKIACTGTVCIVGTGVYSGVFTIPSLSTIIVAGTKLYTWSRTHEAIVNGVIAVLRILYILS